jgi:hypothetical protein
MKHILFILLICLFSVNGFAQTSFLKEAVAKLDKALIAKDTIILKQLLNKDLTYGHSNGWVETKTDVINDIISGKLSYYTIDGIDVKWILSNNVATMRNTSFIKYEKDGKPGELNLHVLQVWLKTNKGWQLLARQSTKL